MRRGYSFRPKAWSVALSLAACAGGIALGNWQAGRAEEKRSAGTKQVRVEVRGSFEARYVLLDNKLYRGRTGYHVIQPLRIAAPSPEGGQHVLVNRGWVAAGSRREDLPAVRTVPGEVTVEGVRLERIPRAMDTGAPPAGIVWQNVSVEAFGAWSRLRLLPWVIEQHSPADDGLVRDWPRPDLGIEKHESYSLQWYALSVLSIVLLVVLNLRRDGPAPR